MGSISILKGKLEAVKEFQEFLLSEGKENWAADFALQELSLLEKIESKTFDSILMKNCKSCSIKGNAYHFTQPSPEGVYPKNEYLFENYNDFVTCKIQKEHITFFVNEFKTPNQLEMFILSLLADCA